MNIVYKSSKLLRKIFNESKLSQPEVAKKIGIHKSNISLILTGTRKSETVVSHILKEVYQRDNKLPTDQLLSALQTDGYNLINIIKKAEIPCSTNSLEKLIQNGSN